MASGLLHATDYTLVWSGVLSGTCWVSSKFLSNPACISTSVLLPIKAGMGIWSGKNQGQPALKTRYPECHHGLLSVHWLFESKCWSRNHDYNIFLNVRPPAWVTVSNSAEFKASSWISWPYDVGQISCPFTLMGMSIIGFCEIKKQLCMITEHLMYVYPHTPALFLYSARRRLTLSSVHEANHYWQALMANCEMQNKASCHYSTNSPLLHWLSKMCGERLGWLQTNEQITSPSSPSQADWTQIITRDMCDKQSFSVLPNTAAIGEAWWKTKKWSF